MKKIWKSECRFQKSDFRSLGPKSISHFYLLKSSLCILISLTLLSSCTSDPKPKDLIPQDRMVTILREFHLAQTVVEKENINLDIRKAKNHEVYDLILDHYGEDREVFYESYNYYLTNPALMDTIYTKIIDQYNHKLPSEQEKKFNKTKGNSGNPFPGLNKTKLDSLKKAAKISKGSTP